MERPLKTFKDANGESWRIKITIGKVKEVRDNVNDDEGKAVDLFDYVNGNLAYLLFIDPVLFGDVLWTLCKDEAEGRKLTKEAFQDLLSGETLEQAERAFMEAFADFFPQAQKGQVQKIAETAVQFRQALRETQLKAISEQIEKLMPKSCGV